MNLERLTEFTLGVGAHNTPEDGLCAMEAVAWLEGEPHSDAPECVCHVISDFVRSGNDYLKHKDRQKLIPYLPKLVGTKALTLDRLRRANYLITNIEPVVRDWDVSSSSARVLYRELSYPVFVREFFRLLDGLLEIGPKGVFNVDVDERVDAYKELFA